MQPAQFSAITAGVLLAALAVFQAALLFGAPLGRFPWDGQHNGALSGPNPAAGRRGAA